MKKEKRQIKVKKSRNFAFLIVLFSFSFLFFNLAASSADAAIIGKPPTNLGLVPLEVRNKVSAVAIGNLLLTGQVGYLPR